MDYMFQIMALPEAKQAEAMRLFKQLQEEFASHNPDYGLMDSLEYQLDQQLN
jgi:hypothetical protein